MTLNADPVVNAAEQVGLTGMARLIANAATRSLVDGSDFGDNILTGLPDVLEQTVNGAYEAEAQEEHDQQDILDARLNGGNQQDLQASVNSPIPVAPIPSSDILASMPPLPDLSQYADDGADNGPSFVTVTPEVQLG